MATLGEQLYGRYTGVAVVEGFGFLSFQISILKSIVDEQFINPCLYRTASTKKTVD